MSSTKQNASQEVHFGILKFNQINGCYVMVNMAVCGQTISNSFTVNIHPSNCMSFHIHLAVEIDAQS